MPQFILKIDLGNDAVRSHLDVARALRRASDMVAVELAGPRTVKDGNGNVVGHYEVVD